MSTAAHKERLALQEKNRDKTVAELQSCLVDLIDLTLQSKQAHWNLIGRRFRSLHLQLDEIFATAQTASDEVAERIAALNVAADGRVGTIASQSDLEPFPEGRIQVEAAVTLIADRLDAVIRRLRKAIKALDEADPVSQDLLIGVCGELEKHLWMVQVQEEEE